MGIIGIVIEQKDFCYQLKIVVANAVVMRGEQVLLLTPHLPQVKYNRKKGQLCKFSSLACLAHLGRCCGNGDDGSSVQTNYQSVLFVR